MYVCLYKEHLNIAGCSAILVGNQNIINTAFITRLSAILQGNQNKEYDSNIEMAKKLFTSTKTGPRQALKLEAHLQIPRTRHK